MQGPLRSAVRVPRGDGWKAAFVCVCECVFMCEVSVKLLGPLSSAVRVPRGDGWKAAFGVCA
jgi:hypothetical protein